MILVSTQSHQSGGGCKKNARTGGGGRQSPSPRHHTALWKSPRLHQPDPMSRVLPRHPTNGPRKIPVTEPVIVPPKGSRTVRGVRRGEARTSRVTRTRSGTTARRISDDSTAAGPQHRAEAETEPESPGRRGGRTHLTPQSLQAL